MRRKEREKRVRRDGGERESKKEEGGRGEGEGRRGGGEE